MSCVIDGWTGIAGGTMATGVGAGAAVDACAGIASDAFDIGVAELSVAGVKGAVATGGVFACASEAGAITVVCGTAVIIVGSGCVGTDALPTVGAAGCVSAFTAGSSGMTGLVSCWSGAGAASGAVVTDCAFAAVKSAADGAVPITCSGLILGSLGTKTVDVFEGAAGVCDDPLLDWFSAMFSTVGFAN